MLESLFYLFNMKYDNSVFNCKLAILFAYLINLIKVNNHVKNIFLQATAAKLVENGFDFTDSQVDDPEVKEEVLRYNLQGEWVKITFHFKAFK